MPVDQISNFTFISSPHADYVQGQTAIFFALFFNHPWSHFRLLTEQWEKGHILRLNRVMCYRRKDCFPCCSFTSLSAFLLQREHIQSLTKSIVTPPESPESAAGFWQSVSMTVAGQTVGPDLHMCTSSVVFTPARTHTPVCITADMWEFKKKKHADTAVSQSNYTRLQI